MKWIEAEMAIDDDQRFTQEPDETGQKSTANSFYDTAEAEELWRIHYGAAARADKIASELDAVFRITETPSDRQYLLRIANNRDGIADLQVALLDRIVAVAPALPVPRVQRTGSNESIVALSSQDGAAHAAFATSFLPGQPLSKLRHLSQENALFKMLARIDRSLDGFSHPRAGRSLLWDVSNAGNVVSLTGSIPESEARDLVDRALRDWSDRAAPVLGSLRRQVIHNDFNPSNILADDSGEITGIIDFGDAIEAPLVCNLATAIAYQEPRRGFDALLATTTQAYASECPLTRDEAAILPVLVRARAAMVVTIAHWRAEQQPTNRNYLLRNVPAACRLLRSAARRV